MPNYNIRELQLHIKEMLMAFHNICKEHDLHYYILFGTMLGAVRHKGFIPWDDDIDVGLPRPEYEMLIRHAKEWFPEPYEFICHETDENFLGGIGKMQDASTTLIERSHVKYVGGVYIDIFPLDGISSSHVAQRIQYLKYEYYKKIIYFLLRDPFKQRARTKFMAAKTYTQDIYRQGGDATVQTGDDTISIRQKHMGKRTQ